MVGKKIYGIGVVFGGINCNLLLDCWDYFLQSVDEMLVWVQDVFKFVCDYILNYVDFVVGFGIFLLNYMFFVCEGDGVLDFYYGNLWVFSFNGVLIFDQVFYM